VNILVAAVQSGQYMSVVLERGCGNNDNQDNCNFVYTITDIIIAVVIVTNV
jgi:hypothetical protein